MSTDRSNPHEEAARLAKVLKMLAILPVADTREAIDHQANELSTWEEPARKEWGRAAGLATPPSERTWRMFVEAARGRRTIEETLARCAEVARERLRLVAADEEPETGEYPAWPSDYREIAVRAFGPEAAAKGAR